MDTPKILFKFHCVCCDFKCNKKSNYDIHILTAKHITRYKTALNDTKKIQIVCDNDKKMPDEYAYACSCGKIFKYHSGLWRHKKTCVIIPKTELPDSDLSNNDLSDKELIIMLLNENKEFKQIIIEQNKTLIEVTKNSTNNTTNNNITHTNSHNKTFNLQFFLNEQCKDALNITEFVSSIKMQITDLETTGRRGYVEGVSRIINKNLKELDMFKRPIHCSDLKRETLYIKNDNEWKKENDDKPLLTKAIKQVANENIRQIGEWKKEHPHCTDSTSRQNDLYLKIVSNAMSGGTSEEQSKNYEKIISNIAKEVVIDK
jgi:hypothetical protein